MSEDQRDKLIRLQAKYFGIKIEPVKKDCKYCGVTKISSKLDICPYCGSRIY